MLIMLTLMSAPAHADEICDQYFDKWEMLYADLTARQLKDDLKVVADTPQFRGLADPKNQVMWTVVKEGAPGYPTVICRRLADVDGIKQMETKVACFAKERECEQLKSHLAEMNASLTDPSRNMH